MPNIYKASYVTLADSAVQIDIGEAPETAKTWPTGPAAQNTAVKNDEFKPPERGKSKDDILEDACDEAEIIILKARNEAKFITDNAKREANEQRAEIEEKARGKGFSEGFNKGSSEAEALKHEASEILRDAHIKRDGIIREIEPQAVELIIKIIEKLVGNAVKINPRIILNLIREGFSGLVGSEGVKVRVSPEDYNYVREHFDEITEFAGSKEVELIKDAALVSMDCVIETALGNIDSSLEQQLGSLKADLLYTLNNAEA